MAARIPTGISNYFSELGKKGGKKGGAMRAANMTQEQRSESARKAVNARWKKPERNRESADKRSG